MLQRDSRTKRTVGKGKRPHNLWIKIQTRGGNGAEGSRVISRAGQVVLRMSSGRRPHGEQNACGMNK